ncbi:MAG: YkoF family thiamine/hydroxymethylpyrimidine-binding protein [Syntrophales bacterium]
MMIQAEISLYPLGETSLSTRINGFVARLQQSGLAVEAGRMSTLVSGESATVFRALQDAFEADAGRGATVMTVKVSNACPL